MIREIEVNSVFISKDDRVSLRVLRIVGSGIEAHCYCILETENICWNAYHSYQHIKRNYDYFGLFGDIK